MIRGNWILRPYNKGDETKIVELLQSVFPEEMSSVDVKWWEWIYKNNPSGDPVIWVAENGDKIIGHRAYIPAKVKLGSKTVIAGQAINTATAAEYRRRGIFSELISESLIEANERGWAFIYNFPNEYSYPGYLKAGWDNVCKISRLIKVLRPEQVCEATFNDKGWVTKVSSLLGQVYLKFFPPSGDISVENDLCIKRESNFDSKYDHFWQEFSKDLKIAIIRNREYLNWRYIENPCGEFTIYSAQKAGKLLGFTVLNCSSKRVLHIGTLKKELHIGNIVEFLVLPNQPWAVKMLLSQSINYFAKRNMDIISCWLLNHSPYRLFFRRKGFFHYPFAKANFVVRSLSTNMNPSILTTQKNWLLSLGDTEAY